MRTKVQFILSGLLISLNIMAGSLLLPASDIADTILLPDVEITVARIGQTDSKAQMQVSIINGQMIDETQANTPKDISGLVPNVYMPNYGSAMTSSIYIRGLGSRINEPVMGMVLDGITLLDKNMYDHTMQDICRIELLRGAQGSLYGRNSTAGVMEIHTIQPLDLTTQMVRGQLSISGLGLKGLSENGQFSIYRPETDRLGWGLTMHYRHTDGYFRNEYTGKKIDFGQQAGGRIMIDSKPNDQWRVAGTVYADWTKQGAFPYADANTGLIAFNRESAYERIILLPSLRAEFNNDNYHLQLSGSYQLMHDNMLMDQDYTTADIFTLNQTQTQHNGTIDALLESYLLFDGGKYNWQVGASGFTKNNQMSAPVTFMREGIEELILGNANRGIQTAFADDSIEISNPTLPILSQFGLYNHGAAVYHQSHVYWGKWHINAGLRLDYEYTQMDYLSTADVNYRFTMLMNNYDDVSTRIEGRQQNHYFQVLPRIALSYEATDWMVYGSAAKGYKAGGYNPQIFSTITQNQVMTDLAADMGMHLNIADKRYSDVNITSYKPEKDWTFEIGSHYTPINGLRIDIDAFHIQCFDQQVTIFPNGKTTGRMMANAARSRIWGVETAIRYGWEKNDWSGWIDASYGLTDARFISFDDGMGNYSGLFIPYAPQHTLNGLVAVKYALDKPWLRSISLSVRANMVGTIYWNEQNDCKQSPYALLGATLKLNWKNVQLQLWGKNLTNTEYNVFYFRSMGNDFLQKGKPIELGTTLKLDI